MKRLLIATAVLAMHAAPAAAADEGLFGFTDMLNTVKCFDGDAAACELDRAATARLEAAERERERYRAATAAPGREPGTIRLGDTQDYVASQWGEPERTDRMVSSYGTYEWWWYGSQAVHFANGLVDSIHTGN
jgi:hypothetical protein